MKKILLLLPFLICLSACGQFAESLVELNNYAASGVVQIVNSPIDSTPKIPEKPMEGPGSNPSQGPDEQKPMGVALGTGFLIRPNVIVTNFHVVAGDNRKYEIVGHNDMKHYTATVIAKAPDADIAILKIDQWDDFVNNVHPNILKWGDSNELQPGQAVWAIGHPYGMTWTLTDGIVGSVLRHTPDDGNYFIQTNVSINPGNSGGPLFNRGGKIIGINTEIFGSKGYIGLSIPSDYAERVVDDLLNGGTIKPGLLGIAMAPSKDEHHVIVGALMLGSNSIAAGLLPNDVILQMLTPKSDGWVDIHQPEDLQYESRLLHPGDPIELYINRDINIHMVIKFTASDPKDIKENKQG